MRGRPRLVPRIEPKSHTQSPMPGLLCLCRPGFEPELAAELSYHAGIAGIGGYAKTERGSGLVQFLVNEQDAAALDRALPLRALIFARQKLRLLAELAGLDPADRVAPVLHSLGLQRARAYVDLVVEHADSDAARPLAGLARAFGNALRAALRKAGLLSPKPAARGEILHVVLLAGDHLLLCDAASDDSSIWPCGIARLRMSSDAPSRSALKLDEALQVLLTTDERERLLKPGMRAADLGAAPGGWSWVLARQHLRVTAIDNGPMAASAMATGLIEHQRADGFRWHPAQPLDWMVCDMVEQPRRVAARMAEWFANGWCRHAIFNLKLPMKKRWDETQLCLDLLRSQAGKPLTLRAKQLYHDREEITVAALGN